MNRTLLPLALLCWSTSLAWAQADAPRANRFSVTERPDRLLILLDAKPVAEFVFRDPKILRPYFAAVRAPSGLQVTRNHPPITDQDPTDHDTMHPGIWLAFGDINGHDFWRNKGRIEHVGFTAQPISHKDRLTFATESRLLTPDGSHFCQLTNRFLVLARPAGWLLVWDATFRSASHDVTFGDQEEMGFGARVATPLAEKNGGQITSSTGRKSAAATWGQSAKWCDYSGAKGRLAGGITLLAAPSNFRDSWWHNRDYGVFVANPFGRAAMKQGATSRVVVKQGELFRLCFAAVIHDAADYDPAVEFKHFAETLLPQFEKSRADVRAAKEEH